jgi:hypothetical protein
VFIVVVADRQRLARGRGNSIAAAAEDGESAVAISTLEVRPPRAEVFPPRTTRVPLTTQHAWPSRAVTSAGMGSHCSVAGFSLHTRKASTAAAARTGYSTTPSTPAARTSCSQSPRRGGIARVSQTPPHRRNQTSSSFPT